MIIRADTEPKPLPPLPPPANPAAKPPCPALPRDGFRNGLEAFDFFTLLFGPDACFVPMEPGEKCPPRGVTYAQRQKAEFHTPQWRAIFENNGLAVRLGRITPAGSPPGFVVAIDFDNKQADDYAAFLALNPKLKQTLQSAAKRGGQIWILVDGPCPDSCTTDRFEWRSDGRLSTLYGKHPSGCDYRMTCCAPPVTVRFEEINWPDTWRLPWIKTPQEQLVERYGEPILVPEKGRPSLNEQAIVAKFALENELLFEPAERAFYLYDAKTGLWQPRATESVEKHIRESLIDLIHEEKAGAGDDSRFNQVLPMVNARLATQLMRLLRSETCLQNAFSNRLQCLVHAANCMIDLREQPWSPKPFNKSYRSRNQCPIPYVADADCPIFKAEIINKLEPDDARTMQLWGGMALLGFNFTQSILVISGEGGTSKSSLAKVIIAAIGRQNYAQLRTEQLQSRFETGLLNGKTLLYGQDVDADFLDNDSAHVLKTLTGGDPLTFEIKGSSTTIQGNGNYNVIIVANSRPMIRLTGDTSAWARRLIYIAFKHPSNKKRIANFDAYLIEKEGPGILNWLLQGATDLMAIVRAHEPFPLSQAQKDRVTSLLSESDSVRQFITECVVKAPYEIDCISSRDLCEAYMDYCDARKWSPVTEAAFSRRAPDIMFEIHRAERVHHIKSGDDSSPRGYRRVVLRQPDDVSPSPTATAQDPADDPNNPDNY